MRSSSSRKASIRVQAAPTALVPSRTNIYPVQVAASDLTSGESITERPTPAFILDQAFDLQQMHGRCCLDRDSEALALQQVTPFGHGKRAGADMNRLGEGLADRFLLGPAQVVWLQAQLVDAVASARFEQAQRFLHHFLLDAGCLHGYEFGCVMTIS